MFSEVNMKRHSKIVIPIKPIKLIELRKYLVCLIVDHNYITKTQLLKTKSFAKVYKIHIFKAKSNLWKNIKKYKQIVIARILQGISKDSNEVKSCN